MFKIFGLVAFATAAVYGEKSLDEMKEKNGAMNQQEILGQAVANARFHPHPMPGFPAPVYPGFPEPMPMPAPNPHELKVQQRVQKLVDLEYNGSLPAAAVEEYLKFMKLKFFNNDFNAELLSPSPIVDKVWHLHILDTKNYARDCIELFGAVIHHNPLGGENLNMRNLRYSRTINAYKQNFGFPNNEIWPSGDYYNLPSFC